MIIVFILLIILYTIIWSLPLYFAVNLVLWLFNVAFRITILQAIGVGFLITVIQFYIKKKEDDKYSV